MASLIVAYSDYIPYMIQELPNCPANVIKQGLEQSARNFCIETESYSLELEAIDIVEDQLVYALPAPAGNSIQRILKVEIDGATVSSTEYSLRYDSQLVLDDSQTPQADSTDGLVVSVVLCPNIGAEGLPAWFMNRWGEAIWWGALVDLLAQPKKPWSNPGLSDYYNDKYRIRVARARREKYAGFKAGGLKIQLGKFA